MILSLIHSRMKRAVLCRYQLPSYLFCINMLSDRKNFQKKNKYSLLIACIQNAFILSYYIIPSIKMCII